MALKFSEETSRLLSFSREEAQRLHNSKVQPEHLLLGLLRLSADLPLDLFNKYNINLNELKNALEHQAEKDDTVPTEIYNIDISESANHLIRLAVIESGITHSLSVEPIHILLALMSNKTKNSVKDYLESKNLSYTEIKNYLLPQDGQNSAPNANIASDDSPSAAQPQSDDITVPRETEEAEQPFSDSYSDDDADNDFEKEILGEESPVTQTTKGKGKSTTPILDNFSTDLTQAAREHKLDPMVGRQREVERVEEVLCRRKKNNPVLIGEPGVGKSAIVEGLAQMIVNKQTSPILFNKRLLSLDLTSIVAGTKYRGQFEERMKGIIQELENEPDIIIFIDELHTLMGSGSATGTMDGANILKPALARGTVQCIGATTLDEYRKSIEKDGAMERRFQKIIVEATTKEQTLEILHNLKDRYEKHHHVIYTDEALQACVDLTERYISDRFFPDKAIDALDEVGARIHLRTASVPPEIARMQEELQQVRRLKVQAADTQDFERAAQLRDKQLLMETQIRRMQRDFDRNSRNTFTKITEENVADVVSMMSNVPVQRIQSNEGERLRNMANVLKSKVIAQDNAVETIVKAIRRNRIGLRQKNHPIGAFMFLGPTGVGKTHLAKKLAEEMFGSTDAIIRVDMSEYSESFNTSRLVGAPPGYVGFDEGGQLTERVRRHPYSIVLLDEIEKAHTNVFNMLLQVLDEGRMTDGNGRLIDFTNTIIIMTSNTGTRQLKDFGLGIGFDRINSANAQDEKSREYARQVIEKSLNKQFAPEFLNRIDEIVMFDQLSKPAIRQIIDIELKDLYQRVEEMGYKLEISDETKDRIADEGYDVRYGARPLKRAIQSMVEDVVCEKILSDQLSEGAVIAL